MRFDRALLVLPITVTTIPSGGTTVDAVDFEAEECRSLGFQRVGCLLKWIATINGIPTKRTVPKRMATTESEEEAGQR